jgi:serine/threonine protein kinase
VIYEMASGKPAFSGKSRASLIAAILTAEPPSIMQLQPLTPLAIERVVKKCLAKDPDERWQSASDLASELNWIAEGVPSSGTQSATVAPISRTQKMRARALWSLSALVLVAAGFFVAETYFTQPPAYTYRARWNIQPPEKNAFHATGDGGGPSDALTRWSTHGICGGG